MSHRSVSGPACPKPVPVPRSLQGQSASSSPDAPAAAVRLTTSSARRPGVAAVKEKEVARVVLRRSGDEGRKPRVCWGGMVDEQAGWSRLD